MTDTTTNPDLKTEAVAESAVVADTSMKTGTMKMARVGDHRIVVVRTNDGFHAIDNACPHQGYGLATGGLEGDLITCQWHNWKYRVSDGVCVVGEEDVRCHTVKVEGDEVIVEITPQSNEEKRIQLWPSFRRGIERFYPGQIARDTVRLLAADATPEELVAEGLRVGVPKTEWGLGHETAVSADLLTLSDGFAGTQKAIPLVQALSGIAEITRDRDQRTPPPVTAIEPTREAFLNSIETEDWAASVAALHGLLGDGDAIEKGALNTARSWFIEAVSQHHYNYGHGAIYVQKVFELLERLDPSMIEVLLSELAMVLVYGTREDLLPYMRKAIRLIDSLDLEALAAAPSFTETDWANRASAVELLLDASEAPIDELAEAVLAGAGIEGLLNIVSVAASKRMLRYDLAVEIDHDSEFGWLDMSHVLTYANAARWAWHCDPGPHTARLAMFTAFLAFDSGRAERRIEVVAAKLPSASPGDLYKAIREGRPQDAVAHALAGELTEVADQLDTACLDDLGGSFIVCAHLVKMAVAARAEAAATGSNLPLAATARLLASPRVERFVTREALRAIEFVETGQPPAR